MPNTPPVPQRRLISSGSDFERQFSYSRAVVAGPWVFVAGTTGFDYATMTVSDDLKTQTEQCLRNITAALHEAGASLADVVRVHYILAPGQDFAHCQAPIQHHFDKICPAATMIYAGLLDPRMKIEIEVTALLRHGAVNT